MAPRRRRTQRVEESDCDVEIYEEPSQSQNTQSRRSQATQAHPPSEELISNTVKAILTLSVNKIPFKKSNITKMVLNSQGVSFGPVLEEATKQLQEIYGIDVHEIKKGSDTFYITSATEGASSPLEFTKEQKAQVILLHLILTFIFMKGDKVAEDNLWEFLLNFRITPEEHEYFGDVKKYVEDTFVKQFYLHKNKEVVDNSLDSVVMYSWNSRANIEFDKKEILKITCEMLDIPQIAFMQQYEEAYGRLDAAKVTDILQAARMKKMERIDN